MENRELQTLSNYWMKMLCRKMIVIGTQQIATKRLYIKVILNEC